jgi:hypothetical protein
MVATGRSLLLNRYRQATDAIVVAMGHVPESDLDKRPTPQLPSARQVIHYLADCELQDSINLRRMLAENTPVLHHWDHERYAERLHYDRPVSASLAAFESLAHANLELLELLTEAQWRREAKDQRPWNITVDNWLDEKVRDLNNSFMEIINAPTGGRVIEDHHDFVHDLMDRIRHLGHAAHS